MSPPPIVESTTAVDYANVGKDFVVVDILAVDDNTYVESLPLLSIMNKQTM